MKSQKVFTALALTSLVVVLGLVAAAPANATTLTGTYYIDNSSVSCSDSGSGTITAPWCSFAPANTATFGAGSQLLLKRGDTFDQALTPAGGGTSASWNVIGAYGEGANPKIQRDDDSTDRGIVMTDPDYWRFQDLEISHAGIGILINYTTDDHAGLDFTRLYLHDIDSIFHGAPVQTDDPRIYSSAGIFVDVSEAPAVTSGHSVIQDISFTDSETYNSAAIWLVGGALNAVLPNESISNVTVARINAHVSQAQTFSFGPVSNVHLTDSHVDCSGSLYQSQGTTCMFVYGSDGLVVANNTFVNMNGSGNSFDNSAIDLEGYVSNTRISGNYFGNIAGSAIEVLALSGRTGDYSTNTVIDSNTFEQDANVTAQGDIVSVSQTGTTAPGGTISNNLYDAGYGFYNSSGDPTTFTLTNNDQVTGIRAARQDFSPTQGSNGWRNQYYHGTAWTDMTAYDSTTNTWSAPAGGTITGSEMAPAIPSGGYNAWVQRTWTAPTTGTIAIRGQIFKSSTGGNGVEALIGVNTVVWPSTSSYYGYQTIGAADVDGYSTDVDVNVTAGDIVQFVVWSPSDSTDDAVSWVPTVAYK